MARSLLYRLEERIYLLQLNVSNYTVTSPLPTPAKPQLHDYIIIMTCNLWWRLPGPCSDIWLMPQRKQTSVENKTQCWLHAVLPEPAVDQSSTRPNFWRGHRKTSFNFIGFDFSSCLTSDGNRDSAVAIAAGYVLDDRVVGIQVPMRSRIFSSPRHPRPVLGPTIPHIQWVPGALSPGVKRPGREADHSPPASAVVKKMGIYISTSPYAFMGNA
jgi:hypothetical protein